MAKQTARRGQLEDFAPELTHLNDDVLFGEVWPDKKLNQRDRNFATVTTLVNMGVFKQLPYHMQKAEEDGISQAETSTLIIHPAFYVGWSKARSTFDVAKKIY